MLFRSRVPPPYDWPEIGRELRRAVVLPIACHVGCSAASRQWTSRRRGPSGSQQCRRLQRASVPEGPHPRIRRDSNPVTPGPIPQVPQGSPVSTSVLIIMFRPGYSRLLRNSWMAVKFSSSGRLSAYAWRRSATGFDVQLCYAGAARCPSIILCVSFSRWSTGSGRAVASL